MRYEWQHVRPDEDGGFDSVGRVVHVAPTSTDPARGAYILVEVDDGRDIPADFAEVPETVDLYAAGSEEPVDSIPKSTFFCGAEKADKEPCEREVNEAGERCWQHPEDDDGE